MRTPRTALSLAAAVLVLLARAGATAAKDAPSAPTPTSAAAPGTIIDSWVPSPCPGPGCGPAPEPDALGLRVVFINFDSVTIYRTSSWEDARDNTSNILVPSSKTLPGLQLSDLSDAGGLSMSQIENMIIERLYLLYAPYKVEFVTTRPSSGHYHMVVFGSTCSSVAGSDCAGISIGDCDDDNPDNVSFVFPADMRIMDVATTAGHELGHALSLGHTDDTDDVMYPSILWSIPTSFGAGNVPDDSGCGASYQNSASVLLATIGARGADLTPPSVTITNPSNGSTITPGSVVTANASDNLAIERVEMWLDSAKRATLTSPPYTFGLPSVLASGQHMITVRAYDISDNESADGVVVTVDGVDPQCTGDGDCPPGESCVGQLCLPPEGPAPGELGASCGGNDECETGICGTVGQESRCTQLCDAASACPDGFECLPGGACWPKSQPDPEPDPEPEPEQSIFTCAVTARPDATTLALWGLAALLLRPRNRRRGRRARR
jgi:hypothetical protein